jgi:nucleoside-diphosphate-sugar epimerase
MILITGITGKSGKWFLEKLKTDPLAGQQYRIVIRNTSNADIVDNCILPIEKVKGDLADFNFVNSIMFDVSTVLHIAGIYTSLNIVKAAINNNVGRLILVHTTGIYSKYKSASKDYLVIEDEINTLIKGTRINLTILRPTMIYGSITDNNIVVFIRMVDKLRFFPIVNHANYLLQPAHEKDLGEAYYKVLIFEKTTRNKNYNLSGKDPILLIDIFKTIGKYLGKTNKFISVPFIVAYFGGWVLYIITIGMIDYREKIQRLVEPRVFEYSDAARDFGYSPVAFEEGVKAEIDEYKKIYHKII